MHDRVLVCDDDARVRGLLGRLLAAHGFSVRTADNGEHALDEISRHTPDLLLLDITMPVMDGVTMLTKLKENPELKSIPVIMLTAESGRENVAYIAKLGVRDYMVKPFQDVQLIEKVKRILELQPKPAAVAA